MFTKVASSNCLHLKSFLYPPHVTLRLWHCWQVGFVSSHFNRLALQVIHPVHKISLFRRNSQVRPPYHRIAGVVVAIPFRLFDCFGFTTPSLEVFFVTSAAFEVVLGFRGLGGFAGGGVVGFITGELVRKAVGDGIVMVSISEWHV